jgi:hypothetical protein
MAPKKAANRNPVPDTPAHSEAPRAEASSNEASENDLPAVPGGKGKRQAYQEAETAAMVAQVLLDRPFAAAHGDTAAAWDTVAQTLASSVEGLEHLNGIRLQTHLMAKAREQHAKEEREVKASGISPPPPTELEQALLELYELTDGARKRKKARLEEEARDEAVAKQVRDDAMRALAKRSNDQGESSGAGTMRKARAVDALSGIANAMSDLGKAAHAGASADELALRREEIANHERHAAADLELRRQALAQQREEAQLQAELRKAELEADRRRDELRHAEAMAAAKATQESILAAVQALAQVAGMFVSSASKQ